HRTGRSDDAALSAVARYLRASRRGARRHTRAHLTRPPHDAAGGDRDGRVFSAVAPRRPHDRTTSLRRRRLCAPRSRADMTDRSAPLTERRYALPLALVTSLFFLWAIGVNLNDVLIPHLKKALDLSDFQSSLIQTAFFGGYFLMALPAGWVMRRVGYRRGILVGLSLCALGRLLFQPAAGARWYPFFLLALFVMAC